MGKYFCLFLLFFSTTFCTKAQTTFPQFLIGTWKQENKENYEQWSRLSDKQLRGLGYSLKEGKIQITEYLDIQQQQKKIIYTGTVLNQNNGRSIDFKLTQKGNQYVFENPAHDFPKKIIYNKLSDTEIKVELTGGKKEISYTIHKQLSTRPTIDSLNKNPNYDSELAKKLNADNYGMKKYVLAILKTGTNDTTDKAFINKCFRGHFENMGRLVKENKLVIAGPLGKNDKTYQGIFILNISSLDEAATLLETDPAIKEKILVAETYEWFGSAALSEYLKAADKIWKQRP